jgi:hypothetical protein
VGKKAKHIQENFGEFLKLAGVPLCFSLLGKESYTYTKKLRCVFENCRAFRFVFHYSGKKAKHIQENFGAFF